MGQVGPSQVTMPRVTNQSTTDPQELFDRLCQQRWGMSAVNRKMLQRQLLEIATDVGQDGAVRVRAVMAAMDGDRIDLESIGVAVKIAAVKMLSGNNESQRVPEIGRSDLAAGVLALLHDAGSDAEEDRAADREEARATHQSTPRRPTGTDVVVPLEDA